MDVLRSDDLGRWGLRVFRFTRAGELESLIVEMAASEWAPFATDAPPPLNQSKPVLGRGENWIAASAAALGQSIRSASFLCNLHPITPGKGLGQCGLWLVHMTPTDFTRIDMWGWIEINGARIELEPTVARASVHFGDFLPDYAGITTVPGPNPNDPAILVNVANSEDVKHGGFLLRGRSVISGYGAGGVPPFFISTGNLERGIIPLGAQSHLEYQNVRGFEHVLFGRRTITATAEGRYVPDATGPSNVIPLGQLILDFRGETYARLLAS